MKYHKKNDLFGYEKLKLSNYDHKLLRNCNDQSKAYPTTVMQFEVGNSFSVFNSWPKVLLTVLYDFYLTAHWLLSTQKKQPKRTHQIMRSYPVLVAVQSKGKSPTACEPKFSSDFRHSDGTKLVETLWDDPQVGDGLSRPLRKINDRPGDKLVEMPLEHRVWMVLIPNISDLMKSGRESIQPICAKTWMGGKPTALTQWPIEAFTSQIRIDERFVNDWFLVVAVKHCLPLPFRREKMVIAHRITLSNSRREIHLSIHSNWTEANSTKAKGIIRPLIAGNYCPKLILWRVIFY